MKGLTKKIMFGLFAVAVACCLFAFAGCSSSTSKYEGEYSYYHEDYYTLYGIKVEVTVNDDDNTIKKVKVISSDYTEVTEALPEYGWTEDAVANWTDNLDALLDAYVGLSVDYVLSLTVLVEDNGEPKDTFDDDFIEYDSSLIISGATQSSGRLLLAVQDALKKA